MKYTAGRFTVGTDGSVEGPKAYMAEKNVMEVLSSSAVMTSGFGDGPLEQLAAVALQTDYAAWAGQREMAGWSR
jgi:hypothetical protein